MNPNTERRPASPEADTESAESRREREPRAESAETLRQKEIDGVLEAISDLDKLVRDVGFPMDERLDRKLADLEKQTVSALEDAGLLPDFVQNLARVNRARPSLARIIAQRGYPLSVLKNLDRFSEGPDSFDPSLVSDIAWSGQRWTSESSALLAKLREATTAEEAREAVDALRADAFRGFVRISREAELDPSSGFANDKDALLRDLSVDRGMLDKLRASEGEEFTDQLLYFLDKADGWKKPGDWKDVVDSLLEVRGADDEQTLEQIHGLFSLKPNAVLPPAEKWARLRRAIASKSALERTVNEFVDDPENLAVSYRLTLSTELLGFVGGDGEESLKAFAPIVRELFSREDVLFSANYDPEQTIGLLALYAGAMDDPRTVKEAYGRFLEVHKTGGLRPLRAEDVQRTIRPIVRSLEGSDRDRLVGETLAAAQSTAEQARLAAVMLTSVDSEMKRGTREFLEKGGVPADDGVLDTWKRCSPDDGFEKKIEREIGAARALESERPGSAAVLRREFGIENFSRYSKDAMVEQYDSRDDAGVPYGIVVNAKTDWSGGLDRYEGHEDPIDSIRRQADGRFRIRVYEAASRTGLAKALLSTRSRYARQGGGKIMFAMIGGHGGKDSIQLGEGEHAVYLRTSDLTGRGAARAGGEFFEPGATVILRSCMTGQEGGIAQQLSEVLDGRVIAPEIPTNIDSVDVRMRADGVPEFRVAYDQMGVAVGYQAGARP